MDLRLLIIKFVTPWIWKFFPQQKVKSLKKFAQIERDSAQQLLQCMNVIEDPVSRAALFQHVLEEYHHHELFDDLAHKLSSEHLNEEIMQREPLLGERPGPKDIVKAYAYAHAGEREVDAEFRAYARGSFDPMIRSVFGRVAADEARHVHKTDEVLVRLTEMTGMSQGPLLFRAVLKLRLEKIASSLRVFGAFQLSLLLSLLYFVFGGMLKRVCNRRLALESDEQFKIFKEQVRTFEGRTV